MKVLIVVDMQYDFVTGPLGTREAQEIVPLVAETIKQMADKNTVCLFTKDTHEDNYMNTLEGKNLPVPHCIKGTPGRAIMDEVFSAYSCADFRDPWEVYPLATTNPLKVDKPTFGSVNLQNILITMNDNEPIEEITLMGVCTGICVLSNAILCKATLPNVPINVIADCCACVTPRSHMVALEAMEMCQINII